MEDRVAHWCNEHDRPDPIYEMSCSQCDEDSGQCDDSYRRSCFLDSRSRRFVGMELAVDAEFELVVAGGCVIGGAMEVILNSKRNNHATRFFSRGQRNTIAPFHWLTLYLIEKTDSMDCEK